MNEGIVSYVDKIVTEYEASVQTMNKYFVLAAMFSYIFYSM